MPPKKPEKEKPKKKWKSFTPEVYQSEMSQLAHFSAKTVNSNTPAFGVRIGLDDRVNIPYVAVSAMDMSTIQVDYQKNAGSVATVVAQVSAVIEDGLQEYDDPPQEDIEVISNAAECLKKRYETPLSLVGMRLRQVILQDENGKDIALTPLQSAGFSKELEHRLDVERKIDEELKENSRRRPHGFIGIGGANPQNVGRHTRSMQSPLWFTAPTENMEVRRAFAIHHRGISIAIPQNLLAELRKWRHALLARHLGTIPTDQKIREKEKEFLVSMTHAVTGRAKKATNLLKKHLDKLPDGKMTSDSLSPIMRGLLDHDLRDRGWKREFAKKLHLEIIDSKVWVDGEQRGMNLGEEETDRWISIIEEAL